MNTANNHLWMGAGVAVLPLGEAAEIMAGEVRDHHSGEASLERVVFALWSEEAFVAFAEALGEAEATP